MLGLAARLMGHTPVPQPMRLPHLQIKPPLHIVPVITFLYQVDVVPRTYTCNQYCKVPILTAFLISTEVTSYGMLRLVAKFHATAHSAAAATSSHPLFPSVITTNRPLCLPISLGLRLVPRRQDPPGNLHQQSLISSTQSNSQYKLRQISPLEQKRV